MVDWRSGEEIARLFCVGVERLQHYAERGNLACERKADGGLRYDMEQVARLFVPRSGAAQSPRRSPDAAGFGLLGTVTLGQVPQRAEP